MARGGGRSDLILWGAGALGAYLILSRRLPMGVWAGGGGVPPPAGASPGTMPTALNLPGGTPIYIDPATGQVYLTEQPGSFPSFYVPPGFEASGQGDPFLRGEVYGPYFCQGLTGAAYDQCVAAVGG